MVPRWPLEAQRHRRCGCDLISHSHQARVDSRSGKPVALKFETQRLQGRSVALAGDGSVVGCEEQDSSNKAKKAVQRRGCFQRSPARVDTAGSVLAGTLFSHRFPYSTTVDHAGPDSGTTLAKSDTPQTLVKARARGFWGFRCASSC
jgi:hypothetical protein